MFHPPSDESRSPDTEAEADTPWHFRRWNVWLFLAGWHPADPEVARHVRLITNFGFLGSLFGACYAAFYFAIGHEWGAWIIVVCSLLFLLVPYLLRATRRVVLLGHFIVGVMAAGFTALCLVEGGMDGHAIAWLVSVPLCGLLLVGKRAGGIWMLVSFGAAGAVVAAQLLGFPLTKLYADRWHSLVTAVGYLGLIAFMFLLGLIFELGREKAFGRMRKALGELEISNRRLEHLNREKNEFLGIAAHDLKNPLTVVVGNAQLIGLLDDRNEVNQLAHDIQATGLRMSRLITRLLDANAIEEGRYTSQIERCDVAALVAESVRHNRANAERKQIGVEVRLEPALWARADRAALVQVVDNLLSNAIKYSPPGSSVCVRATAENGWVVAAVTDQGPGLSEADQAKLFQKFTRLTAKPTGGESSTGLGLSIVKRLAEAMGGSVGCSSRLGEGATFFVRLVRWEDATV